MRKMTLLSPIAMLLLSGCALFSAPVPIAASCPPLPPAPRAVTEFAMPETSLIEDSAKLLDDFRNDLLRSLQKASGDSI